jgi:Queuosine biosynthesis protein QueC
MPESQPHVVFDADGVCNLCKDYDVSKIEEQKHKLLETDFLKILNKHRGKGKYDVMVMCSGGKDSTSALYYMKTRYEMNPLAFTFDNGFETEEALDNVKRAVDKLGVDFLFFKSDYMKGFFSEILRTNSKAVICHPCSIWYMELAFDTARRYEIPLIIAGWTKGQSTNQQVMSKCGCGAGSPEFQSMSEATNDFIKKMVSTNPRYKDFPVSMAEVLKRAQSKHKALVLSPHWFLPFDQEAYVQTIMKELGWKYPKLSYPGRSTNCALNFISVHNSLRDFGFTHYHVEMSKMIRQGIIRREDALKDLEFQVEKSELNKIAQNLGHIYG